MKAILFSGVLPNQQSGDVDDYWVPYSAAVAVIGLFFVSRRAYIVLKERWKHRHS